MVQEDKERSNPNFKWYAIRVGTNMENQALMQIDKMISKYDLDAHFGRKVKPTEQVVQLKGGQKKTLTKKLFPGYLFLELEMSNAIYKHIVGVKPVLGFVGAAGSEPKPISDREMKSVLCSGEQRVRSEASAGVFTIGENVKVVQGPFKGFEGSVVASEDESDKLKISVMMFGEQTNVELTYSDVEKDK
jgi:transcription termination/antitermination protein NusG